MDPSAARRKAKDERAAKEVVVASRSREVAAEWLATRELSWAPRYAASVKGRLEADIYPAIGDMDVAEITPRQIQEVEQGCYNQAPRDHKPQARASRAT